MVKRAVFYKYGFNPLLSYSYLFSFLKKKKEKKILIEFQSAPIPVSFDVGGGVKLYIFV